MFAYGNLLVFLLLGRPGFSIILVKAEHERVRAFREGRKLTAVQEKDQNRADVFPLTIKVYNVNMHARKIWCTMIVLVTILLIFL